MVEVCESQARRAKRMARIDAMPPDIRACVHDFGLTIVQAMLEAGVKKAKHIRHIVRTVRDGSYQGPRDGKPAWSPAVEAARDE